MKNLLIVHYLPRGERSQTKKLVDTVKTELDSKLHIQELDLTEDVPDMFVKENVSLYYRRNYAGENLGKEELKILAKIDCMTEQLLNADYLVLAFPMYNFSMPAIVKAWVDSVSLKGKTWDINETGYVGLMKGKKAFVLATSGAMYTEEAGMKEWEHAFSLATTNLTFLGLEVETITAQGMNMLASEEKEKMVQEAQGKIREHVKYW